MSISRRLKELGLSLEPTTKPMGNYLPAVVEGRIVFCAGATCMVNGKPKYTGKIGRDLTVEEGYDAAGIAALNMLQKIADVVGNVDRIDGVIKLVGHINCTDDFSRHAEVVNGASDMITDLLGDAGRHARLSLGTNSLPNNLPIEIEVVARLADG